MTRQKISINLLAAALLSSSALAMLEGPAHARFEPAPEPPTEPKEPTPSPQVQGFEQELAHAAFYGFEPYEVPVKASPPSAPQARRRSKGGQRRAERKEWWRR